MRPSVLAALGIAAALFVGAGTFVALDSRLGASGDMPAAPASTATDSNEPEISIEAVEDADDALSDEETAPPSVSETPTPEPEPEVQAPPPPPEPERQRPEPTPQPERQRPAPPPRQPDPVAEAPACDPAPLIRRITQLSTRDCPAHTDPDRKRACYAEIERLNSQLADCTS
ncbi:MAG: hypothetical protein AAFQ43_02925 [Bacteroidota bacterium]